VSITRGAIPNVTPGVTTSYALPDRIAGTQTHCDYTDNLSIYPRETRHSVFAGLNQDLTDSITLDVRAFYTRRDTNNFFDLNQSGGFSSFAQSGTITSANPFYV